MLNEDLKLQRENLGYTQQEIAQYIGITKQHVSFIENGRRKIEKLPAEQLRAWCELLNMNFNEVLKRIMEGDYAI